MSNLQIICDSLADIPNNIIDRYKIEVVPLTILINGKEYRDGIDISNKDFYNKLEETKEMPKTSQATCMQFEEIFKKYNKEGKKILYISGSSKITGTYQSSNIAKNEVEGDITIFDSLNLSYGCGAQVVKACEMNEKGYSLDIILKELERIRANIKVLFMVGTLEFLKNGGRITIATATIGSALNIKPIIEVKNGNLRKVTQVRGTKNAINKLIELSNLNDIKMNENIEIALAQGNNLSDLIKLENILKDNIKYIKTTYIEIGASIGSHTGPGTIGICVY